MLRNTIGVALGLAVLCGMSGITTAGPLDKSQVSADAKWVVHTDVEGFLASKTGGAFTDLLKKQGADKGIAAFAVMFGFDPLKDVKGITLYGAEFKDTAGVALLDVNFDREKILTLLKANQSFKEDKCNDHAFYSWVDNPKEGESADKPGPTKYGCFFGKTGAVITQDLDMLKKALDVLDSKADTLAKKGAALSVEPSKGAFVVAAGAGIGEALASAKTTDKAGAAVISQLTAAAFELGEAKDKVYCTLSLTGKTEAVATDLWKIVDGLLALVDLFKPAIDAGDAKGQQVPKELVAMVKDITVAAEGKTVTVKMDTSVDNVIGLLKYAAEHPKGVVGPKVEVKVETKIEGKADEDSEKPSEKDSRKR